MQRSRTEGGSAAVIRNALRRVAAARRRLKKGKAFAISLRVMAQAKRDMEDLRLCADYQRRKGAGTLELVSWEDARKRLGL